MPSTMVTVYESYAEACTVLGKMIEHRFGTDPDVLDRVTLQNKRVKEGPDGDVELVLAAYPTDEGPESSKFIATMVGKPRRFLAEFPDGFFSSSDGSQGN